MAEGKGVVLSSTLAGDLKLLQYVCRSQHASKNLQEMTANQRPIGNTNHHSVYACCATVWEFCTKCFSVILEWVPNFVCTKFRHFQILHVPNPPPTAHSTLLISPVVRASSLLSVSRVPGSSVTPCTLLSTFPRKLIGHDMTFDRLVSAIGKVHEMTCQPRSTFLCCGMQTLCVDKICSKQEHG